ncbi:hypothetical protein AES38_10970 [Clavibacter capsici]|nr:hypothetical protein AES38_10970 [Clavibacter capsici]
MRPFMRLRAGVSTVRTDRDGSGRRTWTTRARDRSARCARPVRRPAPPRCPILAQVTPRDAAPTVRRRPSWRISSPAARASG